MVLQQGKQDQQQTLESAVEKVIQRSGKLNMTYAERVGMRSGVAVLTNTKRDPPKFITIISSDAGIASRK